MCSLHCSTTAIHGGVGNVLPALLYHRHPWRCAADDL